jgi:hypothetical protein
LEVFMQNAELKTIELNEPDRRRGLPFMEVLAVKASTIMSWNR